MINSLRFFLVDRLLGQDKSLYNVLEYNGCQYGWSLVASRVGANSASLLCERFAMIKKHKKFKVELAWFDCVQNGELLDVELYDLDRPVFTAF